MPAKAKTALVAEAKAEAEVSTSVKFNYDGVDYEFDRDVVQDVAVVEALQDDKILALVRAIVGPLQWKVFNSKRRTMPELHAFADKIFEGFGTPTGESTG